jgi:hypothetical protein
MVTYFQDLRCSGCGTRLTITAVRNDAPTTTTPFAVTCPACHKAVRGNVPVGVVATSLQIAFYERPAPERVPPKRPGTAAPVRG